MPSGCRRCWEHDVAHRRVSRLAAEAARLTADLQRKGATDVRCGCTGYADGSAYTVTCSGVLDSSSFDSLRESEVATVTSDR